jgi:SAM-dependent methyltransferase
MLLYGVLILFSAFLLFQVQPVIAKMILPWFGGSAAVWTTCLLFFQVALLLGYAYAYASVRYLRPRAQGLLHAGLLLASLVALPVIPGAQWKPLGTEDPAWRILMLLSASVGLPYFLLSSTGPLLQAWLAREAKDKVPYRLYALSNAGSMFALLSYPVLIEPVLTTRQQGLIWSASYGVFALLCGFRAWGMRGESAGASAWGESVRRPGWGDRALWVALAACASILLLAVTNHLSQNVAAIPFLWVLPLSIYLLSFILCFEGGRWYPRGIVLRLAAASLVIMAYAFSEDFENTTIKVLIPVFSIGLFACCMFCHGELARLKPHPRHLTSFYMLLAAGGALGGVFVGLIAPRLFPWYLELPAGMVFCALLILAALKRDAGLPETPAQPAEEDLFITAEPEGPPWIERHSWVLAGVLAVGLAVYLTIEMKKVTSAARLVHRNFYGGLRVIDTEESGSGYTVRKLMHGTINHGQQILTENLRTRPASYYGPSSGIGMAIQEAQKRPNLRVAVIGLGTGSLAAYGRAGDVYRYYEINPAVIDIARKQFTYLRDTKAKVEIALGDARISLEREQPNNFDVMAVDAFSSDAIPVHLLTREAFAVYFRHLKPEGVLVVHISNKYLDLGPVVERLAREFDRQAKLVDSDDDDALAIFGSTWALISAREELFQDQEIANSAIPIGSNDKLRMWTDDYSNLFRILK